MLKKELRVLFIDVNYKSGSTGKIVADLAEQIASVGHSALVCYGRGPTVNDSLSYKFGLDFETKIHAFLTRITGLTGMFSYFSTRRLIRKITEYNPSLIHIHELHAYFVNLAPLMKHIKNLGIPVIWTFHCEFMFTGKCGYSYECQKWRTQCGPCPYLHDYPKSLIFDWTRYMHQRKKEYFRKMRNVTIVTPSKWLRDKSSQSFLKRFPHRVIHNGVSTSVFRPYSTTGLREKLNIGQDQRIVLAVAPNIFDPRKGGDHVLRLADRFVTENIVVVMVGTEKTCLNSESNVRYIARTENQHQLAEIYSLADVFVICSRMENFPTTCIEAIACGTPVCGFDSGGTSETAPAPYGKFVQYGDIPALYNAVQSYLILSDEEMDKLSRMCAEYGQRVYSHNRMMDEYLQCYHEIV